MRSAGQTKLRPRLLKGTGPWALLTAMALSGSAPAQAQEMAWYLRSPGTAPPPRYYSAMGYDSARGRVVLFGGWHWSSGNMGDTWEWDGQDWVERLPATSPPGRFGHGLTYDSLRARMVLFAGGTDGGAAGDTWEWDGQSWAEQLPAVSPPPRRYAVLAYDQQRQVTLLFGGLFGSDSYLPGTWEWDGQAWIQRSPGTSPPGRYGHGMAYDASRDRTVLVGGYFGCCSSAEIWEWDGTDWAPRSPDFPHAYGRHYITLVYDSYRERTVFWGGRSEGLYAATLYYDGTWDWDGTAWGYDYPVPSPLEDSDYALAYDSLRREMVLLRYDETWVYREARETICDGADDNDNGQIDEGCDDDSDGYCTVGMILLDAQGLCPFGGGDCAPEDPQAISPAPEIQQVGFLEDGETLVWDSAAPDSGSGTVYDVVSGNLGGLPVEGDPAASCAASEIPETSVAISAIPSPGRGTWHLVRGANACGPGSYGVESGGAERVSTACP